MKRRNPKKYYKDEEILIAIGQKIKSFRLQKDISLETLAGDCDVDYSQISRMERGVVNFGISYLYKVAAALNVDPKELLP